MKVDFKIGKNKYVIRELTLEDHYAIQTELTINDKPGFFIISLLSGCPIEELRELPMDNWEELWTTVQAYLINVNQTRGVFKSIIELDGKEYGMVDLNTISVGEFADLDVIVNSTDADHKAHEAMAILYRPITVKHTEHRYEIEEYNTDTLRDRAHLFRRLKLIDVRRSMGFFLGTVLQSTEDTLRSLEITEEMEKAVPEIRETILLTSRSLRDLGTTLSSLYQIQIPSKSTELQDSALTQHSIGSLTSKTKQQKKEWSIKNLLKNIKNN